MIDIRLTPSEVLLGCMIGVQRHIEALFRGLPDKHGADEANGWSLHIEGACGEEAVGRALNRYWGGSVNTFKTGGDLGDLQIRTRSRHDYDLLIRPDDRDEDTFILVTGKIPQFHVVGWIKGVDAKLEEFKQEYGGRPEAYFVPQHRLTPFGEPR